MNELKDLIAALAKAQGEFPLIPRSTTVKVKTTTGGEYTFRYAPLDVIRDLIQPVLAKHGLAITQYVDDGSVVTRIMHESGGYVDAGYAPVAYPEKPAPRPSESDPAPRPKKATSQEVGSALTYARRYSLTLALNLATEDDDDGNHASGNTVESQAERPIAQAVPAGTPGKAPAEAQVGPTPRTDTSASPPVENVMEPLEGAFVTVVGEVTHKEKRTPQGKRLLEFTVAVGNLPPVIVEAWHDLSEVADKFSATADDGTSGSIVEVRGKWHFDTYKKAWIVRADEVLDGLPF